MLEEIIKKNLEESKAVEQEWIKTVISFLKNHQNIESAKKEMVSLYAKLRIKPLLEILEKGTTIAHLSGMNNTQEEYDAEKNLGRNE